MTTPSYPETDISTATTSYKGWVNFTRFALWNIVAIVALLVIMAVTLV